MSDASESVPRSASHRSPHDTNTGALSERDTLPPEVPVEPEEVMREKSSSKRFGTIPAEFGRYRILKLLGQGAMGSVYLAHDTQLDRKVALKIPKFRESETEVVVERFYREARSSATLRSAHICPIYDVGEIGGIRYISMAYIAGRRLSDYLTTGKHLSARQIALLVRKLALALQEAHDRGVVHRDLKPSNIMLDEKYEPIIMDFGLARQMDQTEDERLTQEGAIIGSPAYMSPEQVAGRWDKIGPACDIYSLGVVLYELLTGQTPFKGSIAYVIGQIVSKSPKKPSGLRPDVDARLEAICLKMMAKRIKNRYASMKEVADALTDYLKSPTQAAEGDDAASRETLGSGRAASGKKPHKVSARDVAALFELSQEFMEKHDYAQVIQLLEAIPTRQRTNAILELLEKATDYQDEVTWLISDLRDAVSKHEYEGLLPNVKRLLELKPGHEKAQKLYAKLTGKPITSRKRWFKWRIGKGKVGRIGKDARTRPAVREASLWRKWIVASVAVFAIVFAVMSIVMRVYLSEEDSQTRESRGVGIEGPVNWINDLHTEKAERLGTSSDVAASATLAGGKASDVEKVFTNSIGMKLVLIPPGEFLMGSPDSDDDVGSDEKPQHRVHITKGFYLGQTEVTQGQWQTVMATQPWKGQSDVKEGADYAATCVSWDDAQQFCRRLSQKEGVSYRLPTEAEWEYACRAGTTTKYYFGDDASRLGDYALHAGNAGDVGERYAHQVGLKQPNPFGLYDLHGNVWEWCQDWYNDRYYATSPIYDPTGSGQGSSRVYRGGDWCHSAGFCRSADRSGISPDYRGNGLGFRVALSQSGSGAQASPASGAGSEG